MAPYIKCIKMIRNILIKNFEKNIDEIYEELKSDCSNYGELYDSIKLIGQTIILEDNDLGMAILSHLKKKVILEKRGLPINR